MDITVTFPGGKRVDAQVGNFTVHTDQPALGGGDDTAPAPFSLFLSSLGTCAGIYVLSFLQNRGLPWEGVRLHQRHEVDPVTHRLARVRIEIELPPGVPEKYRPALVRAAEQCAVKRTMEAPPEFEVVTVAAP